MYVDGTVVEISMWMQVYSCNYYVDGVVIV